MEKGRGQTGWEEGRGGGVEGVPNTCSDNNCSTIITTTHGRLKR